MLLPTQDDSRLMILVRVSTAPHRLFLLLLTTSHRVEESRRLRVSRYRCMNMLCPAPAPPVRCPEPHATLPDVCASRPLAMRLQACFDYTLLHGCS